MSVPETRVYFSIVVSYFMCYITHFLPLRIQQLLQVVNSPEFFCLIFCYHNMNLIDLI